MSTPRKHRLNAAVCFCHCLFFACAIRSAAAADHPNVVVVITDDQGYGDIGFHGNTEIHTPTIDSLAKASLRFTNFHVEPTCAETRAALMTGQFPLRNGVWHTIMGRSILRKSAITLPELFQQAGYRTGLFGKWHLGDNYPYRPQDRGFEQTLHLGGGGISQLPDVWGNDYFNDVYWAGNRLQPVQGYCTDVFFNAAKEFIKANTQSTRKKPFFCYVATNAPHSPYNVPDSYRRMYLEKGIEQPRANFYGMITNIDDNLAQLLAVLEQTGVADDTIVIFMTDNGSAAGFTPAKQGKPAAGFNAGMRAQKGSQYDGGHRAPCFIRYPNELPADRDFSGLCAHVDLLPTLAHLCRLDTSSITPLDGRDLVEYVNGKKPWTDRTLIVQSHRVEEPVAWRKSAVMTDRWRLVDGEELYDVQADPGQKRPLEGPQYAETNGQLKAAYQRWWAEMAVDPNKYSSIVLGAPEAERVRLTGHDLHSPQPTVMQTVIEQDPVTEGFWAVEVARAGAYQFLLSRRPMEQPGPVGCTRARIEVGSVTAEVTTDPTAVLVPITVRLEPGIAKLRTQLISEQGAVTSACFVTVNYLGDLPQTEIDAQSQRLPGWLHAGDRIAWLGGSLVERAADSGALETETSLRAPLAGLSFVNLGWSGDDYSGSGRALVDSAQDGKSKRLSDLQQSGASVVVIAYGMSELLGKDTDAAAIQSFEEELRELITATTAQHRRAVLCLPPELINDVESTPNASSYDVLCADYNARRGPLLNRLRDLAADLKIPVVELPAVQTTMFEAGTDLSRSGYRVWSAAVADAMFADAQRPRASRRSDDERLYQLASEGQRMIIEMVRLQDQSKDRQVRPQALANHAVELGQFRALIADKQLALIQAAASSAASE